MNIYNNINNMPNLEDFKIIYKSMRIIDITFKDFISKILHAKFISKVKILKSHFLKVKNIQQKNSKYYFLI